MYKNSSVRFTINVYIDKEYMIKQILIRKESTTKQAHITKWNAYQAC